MIIYVLCLALACPVAWYWEQISPDLDFWDIYPILARWISGIAFALILIEELNKYFYN